MTELNENTQQPQNNEPKQVTEQEFFINSMLQEVAAQRNQALDNNVKLIAEANLAKAKFEDAARHIQQQNEIIKSLTSQLAEKEALLNNTNSPT